MEISDLTQSVRELWNFAWPAAVNLILIISILFYVCPRMRLLLRLQLWGRHKRLLARFKGSEILKLLGVPQMIPFLTLFTVIFILFASQNIALGIGGFLPGGYSYQPSQLLINSVSSDELKTLWIQFPQARSFSELSKILDIKYQEALSQDSNALGFAHWNEKINQASKFISYTKFYAFWALLSLLFAFQLKRYKLRAFRRTIYVLILSCLIFAFSISSGLHSHTQMVRGKLTVVLAYSALNSDMMEPSTEQLNNIESNIEDLDENNQGLWWSLKF